MSLDQRELQKLTGEAWQMLTGLEAAPWDGDDLPVHGVTFRTSVVSVTGDWEADVCVHCTHDLAEEIAAAMFMMDAAELTSADVEDAMGELTNVTAGGIQARVPGTTDLTVPAHRVTTSADGFSQPISYRWRADLVCEGRPVVITVHRKETRCAS
jgi:chemotaxis protein CheX